jgi:hypothetical protein
MVSFDYFAAPVNYLSAAEPCYVNLQLFISDKGAACVYMAAAATTQRR